MSLAFGLDQDGLIAAVHSALSAWNNLDGDERNLLGFLLLVQEARGADGRYLSPLARRAATNRVLESALDELARQNETGAAILRARFREQEIIRGVACRFHASPDQINRWQRAAIDNLAAILASREASRRRARRDTLLKGLPPPTYSRLFGLGAQREWVLARLLGPDEPRLVVITGIGGIGKTSLADAVVRDAAQTLAFARIIWLPFANRGAGGGPLPLEAAVASLLGDLADELWPDGDAVPVAPLEDLGRDLRAQPYLVVVDNLETEAQVAGVLEALRPLAGTSRFLLTARARPAVCDVAQWVTLDELPGAAAIELLRHQARLAGLAELAGASQAALETITNVVGGNPLALKLVISLAVILPLPQILADLANSRPGPVEELYRHIYWEAWKTLSPEARQLLQAMPLAAEAGALPEQMKAMSGLHDGAFWSAVRELAGRSLLEVAGDLYERRYAIHRLTETFLRTEIVGWGEEVAGEGA